MLPEGLQEQFMQRLGDENFFGDVLKRVDELKDKYRPGDDMAQLLRDFAEDLSVKLAN